METSPQKSEFSIPERAKSFAHAGRGVLLFVKTTHNSWIELLILVVAIVAGFYFDLSRTDWMFLILAAGMVLAAEAFNTAIEIDINLTSPEYHPFARDTKDVAAGAVLIAAVSATIIGIFIFSVPLAHLVAGAVVK